MAFRPEGFRLGAGGFAVGAGLRAALIGGLAYAAVLAASRQLYATALVLAALAVLVGLDLARSAAAADRVLAQFVDGLMAEGDERPITAPGLRRLADAMDRALARLSRARAERQQRIDYLEALADNVAATLIVVDEAGAVVTANRAARLVLGEVAGPLAGVAGLGAATAGRLLELPAGAREIVRLADNRAVLASVAAFSAPQGGRRRLIALQGVAAELDAVEVKAWQDLARVLAHEMMNSLTPICSLAESAAGQLRASGASADLAEAMEVIVRRGSGLMHFVDRYRQVTDLPPPRKERLALSEVVAGLDRLMAPQMAEAGVAYASRVSPQGLKLTADPDLLEQALINLLKNALDAVRGRDGAAVRLTCAAGEEHVALVVEDNGPGLAVDDPETAFVPFFTTKAAGSGIGLTLSRQIALAHGGRIEHARAEPHGAVFRLVLPR